MSKILDSVWFDKIGIVKTDTGYETKWYIGVGTSNNKELDEKRIVLAGMPVTPKLLEKFFTPVRVLEKMEELEKLKEEHLKHIEQLKNNQQQ